MSTKRLCMLCLVVVVTALAGGAHAQEQTYNLTYKFVPNQTDVTEMTMTGLLPLEMTPGPEANIPAMAFDVNLNMTMTTNQVCRGVLPDGTGQLETTFPLMSTHTSMQVLNQTVETLFKWENGQITMTVNGAPQPEDENLKKLAGILGATMKTTMTPRGLTKADPQTEKLLAAMMSANGGMSTDLYRLSGLTNQLPDHPVKVGDTWKVADTGKLGEATLTGSSEMKLAGIETFEGVACARIEGEARLNIAGVMPANSPMGMPATVNVTRSDMAISFVNRLDLQKGYLVASNMNLCQNMALMISMGEGDKAVHLPATIDNAQMTMEVRHK